MSLSDILNPSSPSESSTSNLPPRVDPNDEKTYAPRSPYPRLFGSSSTSTAAGGEKKTSTLLTLEDYRRLNQRVTERGMIAGLVGGSLATFLLRRYGRSFMTTKGLFLTWFGSTTGITFLTARYILTSELRAVRERERERTRTPAGGTPVVSGEALFADMAHNTIQDSTSPTR